jgi:polynucleotide 5'-hydroxyl-kinase GRC3/NOL9
MMFKQIIDFSLTGLEISGKWEETLEQIGKGPGTVLVLGASDTGKSTIARFLVKGLVEKGLRVGYVDADIGQSTLGPPATIGMALLRGREDLKGEVPVSLHFVGAISPQGYQLPHLVGLRRAVDEAGQGGAEIILVDTTGMVSGEAAVELKYQKVLLLSPGYLLLLQRGRELEPLLRIFLKIGGFKLIKLGVSGRVKKKTREERVRYREESFRRFFQGSRVLGFPRGEVILRGRGFGAGRIMNPGDLKMWESYLGTRIFYGERAPRKLSLLTQDDITSADSFKARSRLEISSLHLVSQDVLIGKLVGLISDGHYPDSLGIFRGLSFESGQFQLYTSRDEAEGVRLLELSEVEIFN